MIEDFLILTRRFAVLACDSERLAWYPHPAALSHKSHLHSGSAAPVATARALLVVGFATSVSGLQDEPSQLGDVHASELRHVEGGGKT
jgi:hypothetical protein